MSSPDVRLEFLESKIAFQEDTIQQLNDALVGQQDRIDALEALVRMMLEQLQGGDQPDLPGDEPPPHY